MGEFLSWVPYDITMRLCQRKHQSDADCEKIRQFLRNVCLLHGRREIGWPVYRWDYWRWHVNANIYRFNLSAAVFLWETAEGSDIPAPLGYTLRALGDKTEHPARSWASGKAFHPDEPGENYGGGTGYRNVQRAPLYRRDLDYDLSEAWVKEW
jgi:hypothetical protein